MNEHLLTQEAMVNEVIINVVKYRLISLQDAGSETGWPLKQKPNQKPKLTMTWTKVLDEIFKVPAVKKGAVRFLDYQDV